MDGRVFLIILDSFGIGGAPDAALYGDEGSDTLATVARSPKFYLPNLRRLGFFNIDGLDFAGGPEALQAVAAPRGAYGRLRQVSAGKDTTIGHWEIAGVISEKPMPVFPEGFPPEMIEKFEGLIGRKTLCHKPYSGTEVIRDYGGEHMDTGFPILYTSADSVFQIAAHEDVIALAKLYEYCELARGMLTGDWGVGRVIARPFTGTPGDFRRTANRHDYSLPPPAPTLLDALAKSCRDVIGVGKISDIFAGRGITHSLPTDGNADGMEKTLGLAEEHFEGLCFVNLVDFDMLYGHRNDVDGYAAALSAFDAWLGDFLNELRPGDLLLITADHGCDPGTPSTDHSREDVPLLVAGPGVRGVNLGTKLCFGCVANTIADYFELRTYLAGESLLPLFTQRE